MRLRFITYATHAGGGFHKLMEDFASNALDIKVVGWGEPWKGYFGKLRALRQELVNYKPNDIVVVLDAFDTRMNKATENDILSAYKSYDKNILFSRELDSGIYAVPKSVSNYIRKRLFGGIINAGMYMEMWTLYSSCTLTRSKSRKLAGKMTSELSTHYLTTTISLSIPLMFYLKIRSLVKEV